MKKTILLIMICFLFLYILPLNIRPLVIPDEVRYAEIPREMLSSGDWIVPRLNGLLYFEKPVMGYWINGIAMKFFGENEFSVRIASAVAAGLSALIVFFLTSIFFYSRRKGVIAASVYLTFLLVYALGVFSVLDGVFSFFLTACIGSFFLAWSYRKHPPLYFFYLVLSGIFCGCAFLTKGFLAFAVPIIVIVPFLIWEKKYKMIFSASWIPILTAIMVLLPWAVLIELKAPDFWNFFFWHEHIKRFFSESAQHKESFFFFFIILPGAMFPWSFLVPASVTGLWKNSLKNPLLRYAICWFVFPFILFSISSGKIPTYILPCFPALAILFSIGLMEYLKRPNPHLFDKGIFCLMGLIGLLITAVIILQTGIIESLHPFAYSNQWKGVLLLVALTVFILVLKSSLNTADTTQKILLVAVAPLCFYFSAHFLLPDQTIMRKCPGELIQRNIHRVDEDTLVFSRSTPVRAVNWYLKRDDVFMLEGKGELRYGLEQKDAINRWMDYEHFYQFVKRNKGIRKIAFIVDQKKYAKIKNKLPAPVFMDSSGNDGFAFIIF